MNNSIHFPKNLPKKKKKGIFELYVSVNTGKNNNSRFTGILFIAHVSVHTLHYPKLQLILYKGFVISTNIEKKHFG